MNEQERKEKDAELERLRAEHEEILLKHAREQGAALDSLQQAFDEIKRLKALCAQAADAIYREHWPGFYRDLIAELRKAAQ